MVVKRAKGCSSAEACLSTQELGASGRVGQAKEIGTKMGKTAEWQALLPGQSVWPRFDSRPHSFHHEGDIVRALSQKKIS